jgi:hypothetical protein
MTTWHDELLIAARLTSDGHAGELIRRAAVALQEFERARRPQGQASYERRKLGRIPEHNRRTRTARELANSAFQCRART